MTDVEALRSRLSPRLLGLAGVSGVGIPGGRLTVYLTDDSPAVRRSVTEMVEAEAKNVPVDFVVTGTFRTKPKN